MQKIINYILSLFSNKISKMEQPNPQPIIAPNLPINTSNDTNPVIKPVEVVPSVSTPFIDPKLIHAIIMVESQGDDNAEGDLTLKDHAYGCMQIRQGVVDIANRYLGTSYKSQDCLGNRDLSIKLFTAYFHVYKNMVTAEDRSKAWNGGGGWKQLYGRLQYAKYTNNLNVYWTKVQKYL